MLRGFYAFFPNYRIAQIYFRKNSNTGNKKVKPLIKTLRIFWYTDLIF